MISVEDSLEKAQIRYYSDGDEEALCHLHSAAYSNFNGPINKTSNDWRRLFVGNPSIGANRILVAVDARGIAGYCAWSNANHILAPRPECDGLLYDMCLRKGVHAVAMGKLLLHQFQKDAKQEGVHRLSVIIPHTHGYARKVLTKCGFLQREGKFLAGYCIVNAELFLDHLRNSISSHVYQTSGFRLILTQDYSDRAAKLGDKGFIELLFPGKHSGRNMPEVTIGLSEFVTMLFNHESVLKKIVMGRIKIQPLHRMISVVPALLKMRIRNPWFMPLIDWR
jgi:hypothetical protein